jgi:hypothetical protein
MSDSYHHDDDDPQHSSVQIYLQLLYESLIAEVVEGQWRNERISGQFCPNMFAAGV